MFDQDERNQIFEIEEQPQPSLLRRMPWWLIGFIALVIGEVTSHHPLGIVVLCLKFGWNDFLIGFWLRRRDPDRTRGAVCAWFYWALGLLRVALWNVALLFVFMVIMLGFHDPDAENLRDPIEIDLCLLSLLSSVVLALGTAAIGVARCWLMGQRVWLSSSIYESCKRRVWPPLVIDGSQNLLQWVVGVTGCIAILIVLLVVFFGVLALQQAALNAGAGIIPVGAGGMAISICVTLLWGCSEVIKRLEASHPGQCWPPAGEVDEPPASASDGEA